MNVAINGLFFEGRNELVCFDFFAFRNLLFLNELVELNAFIVSSWE